MNKILFQKFDLKIVINHVPLLSFPKNFEEATINSLKKIQKFKVEIICKFIVIMLRNFSNYYLKLILLTQSFFVYRWQSYGKDLKIM